MSHARLGPSNHRWPNCPGSVREEARYPDIPGEAAIDGTGSHLLLEMCLQNNVKAEQYDRQNIGANHEDNPNGWMVDKARCDRVQMCLDYITRRVLELKTKYPDATVTIEAESKSDPGAAVGRTDWWGTCDITISVVQTNNKAGFIEVIDYKDGRMWVDAKNNTQLISYLGGKLNHAALTDDRRVDDCRMTIVQPKTNPPIRYHCSTDDGPLPTQVMGTINDLGVAARKTDDPNAPLIAGKHCQWCKANPKRGGTCSAQAEQSLKTVKSMSEITTAEGQSLFESVTTAIADPKALDNDQLSEMASAKDGLLAAFDAVEAEIKVRIEQGQDVSGWAMLPGRATRVWAHEEAEIVKKLKGRRLGLKDIYPPKLVSVAQLLKSEKLDESQRSKIERDMVTTVAGNLTLKKVAQPQKKVTQHDAEQVELMFGNVAAPPSFF